jgi:hypothetical protein
MEQDLARCQTTQHDARFIHIVDILGQDGRVVQLSANDCEPLCHLFIDIMSLPVERLEYPRFQIRVTVIEILGPILVGRLHAVIGRWDLEGGGPLTDNPLR